MYIKVKKELELDLNILLSEIDTDGELNRIVDKLNHNQPLSDEETVYIKVLLNELVNNKDLVLIDTDIEDIRWIIQSNLD